MSHLTQFNIAAQPGHLYGALVSDAVRQMALDDSSSVQFLVGVDISGFLSRREESQTFASLREAGFDHQVVNFGGKTSNYSSVLFTLSKRRVVELVDTSDLKSLGVIRAGSKPAAPTTF